REAGGPQQRSEAARRVAYAAIALVAPDPVLRRLAPAAPGSPGALLRRQRGEDGADRAAAADQPVRPIGLRRRTIDAIVRRDPELAAPGGAPLPLPPPRIAFRRRGDGRPQAAIPGT